MTPQCPFQEVGDDVDELFTAYLQVLLEKGCALGALLRMPFEASYFLLG